MAELIVRFKDRNRIEELSGHGVVTHVSKRLSLAVMEAPLSKIETLRRHPNVLEVRESETGEYRV